MRLRLVGAHSHGRRIGGRCLGRRCDPASSGAAASRARRNVGLNGASSAPVLRRNWSGRAGRAGRWTRRWRPAAAGETAPRGPHAALVFGGEGARLGTGGIEDHQLAGFRIEEIHAVPPWAAVLRADRKPPPAPRRACARRCAGRARTWPAAKESPKPRRPPSLWWAMWPRKSRPVARLVRGELGENDRISLITRSTCFLPFLGGTKRLDLVGEDDESHAVAVLDGRESQHRGQLGGQLALFLGRRAEASRRRHVHQQQHGHLALFDEQLDVRPRSCAPTRSSR
jgi:hypothetical protein